MTTKKQRRQMVAEKTATRQEAERKHGLEMQRLAKLKRDQAAFDADRAEQKKAHAMKLRDKIAGKPMHQVPVGAEEKY